MNLMRLIFKEILYRKMNAIYSMLAVLAAVALFVAMITTGSAYRIETRRIMRNMGQNLRIIPAQTPLDLYWSEGFSLFTMPEAYVDRFRLLKNISYTHLTALLQQKIVWQNNYVILTGVLPEVFPADKQHQTPMTFSISPGTVYIGFELARKLNLQAGEIIHLFGNDLRVEKCLSVSGTVDDIRIYGHLHDIQEMLDLPGQINEIRALECLCQIESEKKSPDPFMIARQQLEQILPDAQVLMLQGMAKIREDQRKTMEGYLAFIFPFITITCGLWILILVMMNVRERKTEIGILQALGYRSLSIGWLFIGRSLFLSFIGAGLGFVFGSILALNLGPALFKLTADAIRPEYGLLFWSLMIAPIFSAVASIIPALFAVIQDPSITLRPV